MLRRAGRFGDGPAPDRRIGHDDRDGTVVRRHGHPIDEEGRSAHADRERVRTQIGEDAVVDAATSAETTAVARERDAGDDHGVEPIETGRPTVRFEDAERAWREHRARRDRDRHEDGGDGGPVRSLRSVPLAVLVVRSVLHARQVHAPAGRRRREEGIERDLVGLRDIEEDVAHAREVGEFAQR